MKQAKHWAVYSPAPDSFLQNIHEHPLLLQVLYNRKLRSATEVNAFLTHSDAVKENPYRLKDMTPAVARIVQAIEQEEVICVYGDFDADGVTSTTLMVSALQAAGGRAGPYIPDRVDEGYGLNLDAIERIAKKAKLIVTVDCGIRSVAEVQRASDLGVDVIVTDHHSVGPQLPPALAVINPRRKDCPSNFQRLAGVGVAYRLAQAVLRAVANQPWSRISGDEATEFEQKLLDLVAIGTVADIMPLLGENRTLVQHGLAKLNKTERPGLESLLLHADLRAGTVDTTAISFRIAPRINAAGRLSNATLAYKLLRTTDPTEAYTLTTKLEALNRERQSLTAEAEVEAEQQLMGQESGEVPEPDQDILVVSSPRFRSGIVGLVAGRLVDRFYRPALVIEQGEEESRGSARSISEFNISQALDEVSPLLLRHGGHRMAAGFTLKTEKLAEFTEALQGLARRGLESYEDLRPTLHVDAEIRIDEINWVLYEQFARLEPTGQENPAPLLLCRNCRVKGVRPVGQGKHLRLSLDSGQSGPVFDAIAFRHGEWAKVLEEDMEIDIVCQVEVNEWQGRRRLQLNIQDMRVVEA